MDVWLVPLIGDPPAGLGGDWNSILSSDEQARAARFRFDADRTRWIRARTALRVILSGCTGSPPHEICFELGRHGKPALAGGGPLEFNLSHSGDWAMVAVAQGVPVGIDIERIREDLDMRALLRRLGDPAGAVEAQDPPAASDSAGTIHNAARSDPKRVYTAAFVHEQSRQSSPLHACSTNEAGSPQARLFAAWTRREAMSKALGGALMEPPTGDFRVCDLEAPTGYVGALALIGQNPRVGRHNGLVPSIGTQ